MTIPKCPAFKPTKVLKGKKSNKAARIAERKAKKSASERQELVKSSGTAMGDESGDEWCCDLSYTKV